jgi:hypothetical protein
MDISNATEGPFIVLSFCPVSPYRISAAKGQNKVNEARGHAQISIDRTCGRQQMKKKGPTLTKEQADPLSPKPFVHRRERSKRQEGSIRRMRGYGTGQGME